MSARKKKPRWRCTVDSTGPAAGFSCASAANGSVATIRTASERIGPPSRRVLGEYADRRARLLKTTAPTAARGGAGWARAPGWESPARPGEPDLVHLDADALRLRLGPLGDEDAEHAVLLLGSRLVGLEGCGEGEGPGEHAVRALDPVVPLALVLALELPRAADGQGAVLEAHVHV